MCIRDSFFGAAVVHHDAAAACRAGVYKDNVVVVETRLGDVFIFEIYRNFFAFLSFQIENDQLIVNGYAVFDRRRRKDDFVSVEIGVVFGIVLDLSLIHI